MSPGADAPPVVAPVADATNTTPITVSAAAPHGLKDGDEVKIDGVEGNAAANGAFYVKVSGQGGRGFALYADNKFRQPIAGTGAYQSGGTIYRPLPEDYAIVVGINDYPAFTPLKGPEVDANHFYAWLVSPAGGMVARSQAQLIRSSDYPAPNQNDPSTWQPALDALKLAFRGLSNRAFENAKNKGNSRVGRRLYIFLSGHGITPARSASPNLDDAALFAASADLQNQGEHLLGYSWAEWFHTAAAFDEIILFMDCCRDQKNNVAPVPCTLTPLQSDRRDAVRVFYAAATGLDSKSWEQDLGTPPERHGVFSYVLMEALRNEALCDDAGRLTGIQLALYLADRVPKLRPDQKPKPYVDPTEDITLVQRRASDKPNLRVMFDRSVAGRTVRLFAGDKLDAPLLTHVANGGPWCLRVRRKLYKLDILGGNGSVKIFELDAGREVTDVQFP